jgi:shikimate dehydrogenase
VNLQEALVGLKALGFAGCNLTLPHKIEALPWLDEVDAVAQRIGAVNTLTVRADGSLHGTNTDAFGFIQSLCEAHSSWQASAGPAVVLGAGGAARGVLGPLLGQSPAKLMIANRSNAKAEELIQLFSDLARSLRVILTTVTLNELEDIGKTSSPFDLIINATAAGLSDESPISDTAASNIFTPQSFAYDMVYGKVTALMQQALHRGARVSDGLGMLVEQAADAFLIWRGAQLVDAIDSRAVLAELRTS